MRLRIFFVLLLVVVQLAGCTNLRPEPVDPWAAYRVALAPGQQQMLDELPALPDYRLDVQLDSARPLLMGRMTVTIPAEPDGTILPEYYFRLYPNLSYYGGSMSINLVTVNGAGAPFDYAADDTAVRVVTRPDTVKPNEPVTIQMQWRLKPPVWEDTLYHLIGASNGVLALPAFYPMLAVRDPQAENGWRLDVSMLQGDSTFSVAATYQMTMTAPVDTVIVASGVTVNTQPAAAPAFDNANSSSDSREWRSWRIVTGPAREMALFASNQYRLAETTAGAVRIRSWYLPGQEAAGRATADYAAAAMRVYSELFGPYPDAELDVVAGPLEFRGMEYTGLIELGFDLYNKNADELEYRVAHEVAHQWWYNLVGNDAVNTPWLDEGLAEFSTYFYVQRVNGQAAAERLVERRWQLPYQLAVTNGLDDAVNQPVSAFSGNYETLVYGKAALFHYALMQQLGEERYLALLQEYVVKYRYGIATPDDFLTMAVAAGGTPVEALYRQWILGE
ncbi:MAG: M1 family metallopeptidase [Anaerolineae bacterium]